MRRALLFLAVLVTALVAVTSHASAGTIYQQWKFKTGSICINDHGWTRWNFTAAAKQWDASTDITLIRSNGCQGYPASQVINLVTYNDPKDGACAKTASPTGYVWEYSYTKQGVKVAVWTPRNMTIYMNMASNLFARCHATVGQRAHVTAHEAGHALGQSHNTVNSVMNYWSLQAPTLTDIKYVTVRY